MHRWPPLSQCCSLARGIQNPVENHTGLALHSKDVALFNQRGSLIIIIIRKCQSTFLPDQSLIENPWLWWVIELVPVFVWGNVLKRSEKYKNIRALSLSPVMNTFEWRLIYWNNPFSFTENVYTIVRVAVKKEVYRSGLTDAFCHLLLLICTLLLKLDSSVGQIVL